MKIRRSRRLAGLPRTTAALAALACAGLLAPPASAQGAAAYDVLFSLTSDDALAGQQVRDQDVLFHPPTDTARVAWPSETLSLLAGDTSGDGLHEVLGDIDALHDMGGGATAADGLLLSLLSNEHGFLDGDVLRFAPSGLQVLFAEADFVAAVDATDGDLDVDAFHLDGDGGVLFSLAEDEASGTLSGDAPGVVRDGAILSWMPGEPAASILFTESGVEAMVASALGVTVAIGDVKGLARDPDDGSILFTVQSPSDHDASVFSSAGGGTLVAGHGEDTLGLDGSPELDALTVARSSYPALTTSSARPQAGEVLTLSLRGAQPAVPHVVLASLSVAPVPGLALQGWGGLVLAPDALLSATLQSAGFLLMSPDGFGSAEHLEALSPTLPVLDVVVQVVAPAPTLIASNPVLLELSQ